MRPDPDPDGVVPAVRVVATEDVVLAEDSDPADRFARHRLIPDWDQDRLAATTAVVVGVGALGNEVVKNLALAGVGRLVLCDPDTVATTNLSRSVLFGPDAVGQLKVTAAAVALRRAAPGTVVDTRASDLVPGVGLGELATAGVVLSCVDTRRARLRLLGRCALVGAPLVDGGTFPWGGEVRIRIDADEPCYGCSLTPHQRGESDLPWSCAEPRHGGPVAASVVSTSIVAGWMTTAALRILFGDPPPYRALRVDGLAGRADPVTFTRAADCPHHRPLSGPVTTLPVTHRDTVADLPAALPPGAEPRAWAEFLVPFSCRGCGERYDHLGMRQETGALISCRRCGQLVRPRSSERLRDTDVGVRLAELGVAPEEILPVLVPEGGYQWFRLTASGTTDPTST